MNANDLEKVTGGEIEGPEFRYNIDGIEYCAVEFNGMRYITEWSNIAF